MHELNVVQTHLFSTVVILFSIHRLISQYSPVLVKIHVPVCALRSLGHGCVQEVKKRYKYCSFYHTNRSFRVLGHQCVVTMGNLDFSVHVLFPSYRDSDLYLPLYD